MLHIDSKGFERAEVEHTAAPAGICLRVGVRGPLQHQAVETPQKGGQRLAGAGGRQNQRGIASRNRRPALALRRRDVVKDGTERLGRDGVKEAEDVGVAGSRGRGDGFMRFLCCRARGHLPLCYAAGQGYVCRPEHIIVN